VLVVAGPVSILIAGATCPTYVELPSGTVFDIARLVEDSGSAPDALAKARADVAQVNAFGGCSSLERSPRHKICQEVMAAANAAIAALEACVEEGSSNAPLDRNRRGVAK
jgi:hypothetical protein